MASPTSPTIEIRGDVYIPLCDKERCQEKLQKLAKALEEKHLKCVAEDQIIGTFERWFKAAFENCKYTIIHRCRHLWDKISIFESRFSDDDLKVMAVDLSTKARNRKDIPRSNSGLNNFFNKFSTTIISDDKNFNAFVVKVVKLFPEVAKSLKLSPDVTNQQLQRVSLTLLQGDDPDTTIENVDIFKPYPDLFGHATNVFLQEMCVACTPQETADCKDVFFSKKGINIEKLAKWQDDVKEKYSPNKKCVIHRLLPELRDAQKVKELTSIASCQEPSLQGEAMILLETMLLSRRPNDKHFDFNTQVFLENVLFEKLSLESDQTEAMVEDKSASVLTERLSLLYVMVLSDTIISRKMDEMGRFDMHLSTIIARSRKLKKAANHLDDFIKEASKKSCSEMIIIISEFMKKPDTEGLGAKLCNENSVVQACVIIETMKLIFNSMDVKTSLWYLKLLYGYIEKATLNKKNDDAASTSLTLLARCLTIFLWFGLKRSKHQNLEDIYKLSSEIINTYLKWNLTEDMYRFIQILLFDNNPVIQKKIFKSRTCVGGRSRFCYGKYQLPFLINHMEKLLSPLLFIEIDESDNPELKTEATEDHWQLMKAKFSNHDTLVRIHIPVVRSHRDKNEAGCTDDIYCREMRVLQKLHHKNIIRMFAFQETHIPLFYVVEHTPINLQTALKYKRDNKDFYQQTFLFKFLVDALSAVEHCHSKLHVHCNLTCESLLIVDDKMAKLCGFHLCLELVDGRGKIDKKNSKKVPIPTRWTAPESLRETEYTTASDVWMFGHLMYEVLTHGQLPYSQIENVDDVSKKISEGTISLPENPSFKKEHYELICECTAYKPNKRPQVNKIKMQLKQFLHDSEKTPSSLASVYSFDSFHKPSTEIEKGIPDLPSSKYFEDQERLVGLSPVTISDTLIRFTDVNVYIFREKIVHQVTQNMEIKVEDGKLSDILPGIRIYQNHGEVHHIECHVPRSCQCCLNLVFEKALGPSLNPYLGYLLQVAYLLKELHERSWILGDFCASYLYFEQAAQGSKVDEIYVVSLAYLLPCEMEVIRISPPENIQVCARAAPEVVKGGMFSSRSDVYCFGHLMWEVLTAFDHLQENVEQFQMHIESKDTTPDEEYLKKVNEKWEKSHDRPRCCSDSLFELILACTVSASVRRITLDTLIDGLQRICQGLTDEYGLEHSAETSA